MDKKQIYLYGMKSRGFSPGAQPMTGLITQSASEYTHYYDVLIYNRKLTDEERYKYELDFIIDMNEEKYIKMLQKREVCGEPLIQGTISKTIHQALEKVYKKKEGGNVMDKKITLFEDYLRSTEREGIEELIEWLRETDFYKAPASTQYHLSKEGGLLEHSLNVIETAIEVNKGLGYPVEEKSLILVSALHDLGKHRYYGKDYYQENILKSGKRSDARPYVRNKEMLNIPHEIISIQKVSKFIDLTENELWAILHHNGMYGDLRYSLTGKETKLQMIVHFADMWASRVLEKEE